MSRVVELEAGCHGPLRLDPRVGAGAGLLVPLGLAEVPLAVADFPLFMAKDAGTGAFELVALIGLQGVALFCDGDGWHATYAPELLLAAPFRLAEGSPTGLAVDRDHPRLGARGTPLFAADGAPAPLLDEMRTRLGRIVADFGAARRAAAELVAVGAVMAAAVRLRFADGAEHDLQGLYVPDAAALADLPDGDVARLHRSGALALAAVLAASLSQLERLRQLHNARGGDPLVDVAAHAE